MSGDPERSLHRAMEERGAVWAPYHDRVLARSFGDPALEYEQATSAVAVFDRSHRPRFNVTGRAPGKMLAGILTGRMPHPPVEVGGGVWAGQSTYHAVLTAKGKMITDLWATMLGEEGSEGYLLDVPVAGAPGLVRTLERVLPPRFASLVDASERLSMMTVVGPQASAVVSRVALGLRVESGQLGALAEGEWRSAGPPSDAMLAVRTEEVWPEAYSILGPTRALGALWSTLVGEGVQPAGLSVWSTLRVEAGRPAFGTDMDEDTIPPEAGIADRAIDHSKGCYTGQEVIVRIRDRGHVNRGLHLLHLGAMPTPASGTELRAADDSGKLVGRITSAVESPRFGGVVALAYVSRGVEAVRIGDRVVEVVPAT